MNNKEGDRIPIISIAIITVVTVISGFVFHTGMDIQWNILGVLAVAFIAFFAWRIIRVRQRISED